MSVCSSECIRTNGEIQFVGGGQKRGVFPQVFSLAKQRDERVYDGRNVLLERQNVGFCVFWRVETKKVQTGFVETLHVLI